EPEVEVHTIADLPFHVLGRIAKPLLIGRVRSGEIAGTSSREFFEAVRDVSLGFGDMGVNAGDRVAIIAESRPDWLGGAPAVLALGAGALPILLSISAHTR